MKIRFSIRKGKQYEHTQKSYSSLHSQNMSIHFQKKKGMKELKLKKRQNKK